MVDKMDECHICGKAATTQAFIEGAKVPVCASCARYGKEVAKPAQLRGRLPAAMAQAAPLKEVFAVEGYGKKIRSAREALGLKPEELAAKVFITRNELVHLEEEKIRPGEKTAKKLEKELDITLLQDSAQAEGERERKPPLQAARLQSRALTLADIVQIKPKK